MKFIVERAPLLRALNHLTGVVETRSTIPILANLMISVADTRLALSGTDLDIALTEEVPAVTVEATGVATAPARLLYDIVRKLRDGAQIEIEDIGNMLTIRSGRSRFSVPTLPPEDYPVMFAGEMPHRFDLPAADLRYLLDHTAFAMSTEEVRYYLQGIYLHAVNTGDRPALRAVATNGHQLAQADVALPDGAEGLIGAERGAIVGRKTIIEMRRLLDGEEGNAALALSDNKISLVIGSATLAAKLVDGTFPDYSRVIPAGNDKNLEIDRAEFSAAIERVATIDEGKSRAIRFELESGCLTVSARNAERGSGTEDLDARWSAPGSMEGIGFNARYLLDVAGQIAGPRIRFDLLDPAGAAVIRDPDDPAALYVLMPMRV